MEKRASLEIIAPSVEEAIAQGLVDLGLSEKAVDVEVLDEGSRGLFGIGSRQARIRLTVKGKAAAEESREVQPQIEEQPERVELDKEPVAEDAEVVVIDRFPLYILSRKPPQIRMISIWT